MCLSSVKDYEEDKIKKHEQTMPKKVEDRTKLADTQGANAGPVFFSFKDDTEVDKVITATASDEPYFNYTDPESHVVHRVRFTDFLDLENKQGEFRKSASSLQD